MSVVPDTIGIEGCNFLKTSGIELMLLPDFGADDIKIIAKDENFRVVALEIIILQ